MQLKCGNSVLDLTCPVVMGILNVTPDSFSDGGKFVAVEDATRQALSMINDGAAIIDIGGESTRPGATAVNAEEESARVIPVIEAIRKQSDCIISVDTSKPSVMQAAVEAGANIINDVRALQEPGALEMVASLNVPVCFMHMQGEPRTMQAAPEYKNVVDEVKNFLMHRVEAAIKAGIPGNNIIIDPGFGFGKTLEHNAQLFSALNKFVETGYPVLVGVSRKSMIGAMLNDAPVEERLYGSVALAALACNAGAKILRVHDVKPTFDAIKVAYKIAGEVGHKEAC